MLLIITNSANGILIKKGHGKNKIKFGRICQLIRAVSVIVSITTSAHLRISYSRQLVWYIPHTREYTIGVYVKSRSKFSAISLVEIYHATYLSQ